MVDDRELNRATMARQLLLRRAPVTTAEAVHHLVGLQSQTPYAPYVGLWTRLEAFDPTELGDLLTTRRLVRMVAMRSTVHLLTGADALALRSVVQPALDRQLLANRAVRIDLAGLDMTEVVAEARRLVSGSLLTPAQLGELLAQRWPDRESSALVAAARTGLPLVQVPPRGVWGVGGQTRYALAEAWLDAPLATDATPDWMILRYLAAFGPASVADMQTWSGLKRLGEVVDRLRSQLRSFRRSRGGEVLDLPDAPRPSPDCPAPPRFLPEYDNVLLSHAERSRVVSEDDRKRLSLPNGMRASVLVDGRVCGSWKVISDRRMARLRVECFHRLSASEVSALSDEAARLLGLVAADANDRDFELVPP